MLVLGWDSPKIQTIVQAIQQYSARIYRTTDPTAGIEPLATDHFFFVLITDTLKPYPDREFVQNLRKMLPRAKSIVLFDRIDEGIEKQTRSAGPSFLGSYDLFAKNLSVICKSAEKDLCDDKNNNHRE